MGIGVRRPTPSHLAALAEKSAEADVTYSPVGLTARDEPPEGYRLDRWSRKLGSGRAVFERGADTLREWTMHREAGLVVADCGSPEVGLDVAMAAPLPVGFVDVVCRVVTVHDEPDRFGFAYGTLPIHPEQGEESFTVTITPGGTVSFEILAVSRSRHPLARLAPPIARRLQVSATNRYLDAMQSLSAG